MMQQHGKTNAAVRPGTTASKSKGTVQSDLDRDHAPTRGRLAILYWDRLSHSVQPLAELGRAWA